MRSNGECDPDPKPFTVTVSDPLGHTLGLAYADSYADAAAFGQSIAHDHPYACSVTVSITYPVCAQDREGVLHE